MLQGMFIETVHQWLPVRECSIQKVEDTKAQLKEQHRKINIYITSGSIALTLAGLLLAPFTFNATLGLIFLGGAIYLSSSFVNEFIEKSKVKVIEEELKQDTHEVKAMQETAEEIETIIQNSHRKCPDVSTDTFVFVLAVIFAKGAFRTSTIGIRIAELVAAGALEIGAVSKGVTAATKALNIILIPTDIVEIVRSGVSTDKESQTKSIEELNKLASELEKQRKNIKELTKIN